MSATLLHFSKETPGQQTNTSLETDPPLVNLVGISAGFNIPGTCCHNGAGRFSLHFKTRFSTQGFHSMNTVNPGAYKGGAYIKKACR